MTKKGIVFCNTCRKIVGDSFPVLDHYHSFQIQNEMLLKNMEKTGFQFIKDTPKNRKLLPRPRKTVTLTL